MLKDFNKNEVYLNVAMQDLTLFSDPFLLIRFCVMNYIIRTWIKIKNMVSFKKVNIKKGKK